MSFNGLMSDLKDATQRVASDIRGDAEEYMADYSKAGVEPRSKEVRWMFEALEIIAGLRWSKKGSFLMMAAGAVLTKESSTRIETAEDAISLIITVTGRLGDMAEGTVDFSRFHQLWEVGRPANADTGDPLKSLGSVGKRLVSLGHRQLALNLEDAYRSNKFSADTHERPYVQIAMDKNAPTMGLEIHNILTRMTR